MSAAGEHGAVRLDRAHRAVLPLFFATGACGLIYQIVWVRQLALSFGISIHAISAVLCAFMAGLGVGAAWIGRRADGVRNPLRLYGFFELAIAASALVLHVLLARGLPAAYRAIHGLLAAPLLVDVARFAIAFGLLVVPTILMGGTLPLLGRYLTRRSEVFGARLGLLYGTNTLGGMTGAALAGFWLIERLGILGTTLATAAINASVGAIALWLSAREPEPQATLHADPQATLHADPQATLHADPQATLHAEPQATPQAEPPARAASRAPIPGIALLRATLFLAGYAALAYEVMWNRTLLPYIHNSTYAFSAILIVFLAGVGLGSLVYARLPKRWTSFRTLGVIELALGGFVWLTIADTGLVSGALRHVNGALGTDTWLAAAATLAVAPCLVVLVPTVLMGVTFPMATALATRTAEEAGVRIGDFYAATTTGNILGSLATGFFLIAAVGLRDAFAIALACNLVAGFLLLLHGQGRGAGGGARAPWRALAAAGASAAALGVFFASVGRDVFLRHYAGEGRMTTEGRVIFYEEEAADSILVVERPDGHRWVRYTDGRGTAGTMTDPSNRMFGHIPMLLHRDPERVLSICFGVGNTLSALAQYEPERLVSVELSPGAYEAAAYFPTNRDVLHTPGLELRVEDGRNFLLVADETFDVIQLEPPEIHTAGVVNLYTREFYELARSRLADDGIVCQWICSVLMPEREMKMLLRTFADAFPDASLWEGGSGWDLLLIGSRTPLRVRPAEIAARYARPRVQQDLARIGVGSAAALLSRHVLGPASLRSYCADAPAISDDWTKVDFSVPRSRESGFGVFVYQTQLSVAAKDVPERHRQRWSMLAQRESASYRIDPEGAEPAALADFSAELERETEARRAECRSYLGLPGPEGG